MHLASLPRPLLILFTTTDQVQSNCLLFGWHCALCLVSNYSVFTHIQVILHTHTKIIYSMEAQDNIWQEVRGVWIVCNITCVWVVGQQAERESEHSGVEEFCLTSYFGFRYNYSLYPIEIAAWHLHMLTFCELLQVALFRGCACLFAPDSC